MFPRNLLATAFAVVCGAAGAQLADIDPDWKELQTPPPPAFNVDRLVAFDMGPGSQLEFGIDPATLAIGSDGIVRYVVVARSRSGAVNAMYEGLRCTTGEVRTYARHNPGAGWYRVDGSEWKSLWSGAATRHALMFARQGGCMGRAAPHSVQDIVRDLRQQGPTKSR